MVPFCATANPILLYISRGAKRKILNTNNYLSIYFLLKLSDDFRKISWLEYSIIGGGNDCN